jgi:hypothetical protein
MLWEVNAGMNHERQRIEVRLEVGAATPGAFAGSSWSLSSSRQHGPSQLRLQEGPKNGGLSSCRLLLLLTISCAFSPGLVLAQVWGRLGNPGFENQQIKATYFFSGDPLPDTHTYTRHPLEDFNLQWDNLHPSDEANRQSVLDQMVRAGINVIHLSTWQDDLTPFGIGAPMQSTRQSHDELFEALGERSLLVVPFLEEYLGPAPPPIYSFKSEFPVSGAPRTVAQIEYLICRYLMSLDRSAWDPGWNAQVCPTLMGADPPHPSSNWKNHWARVYNNAGEPRYAVGIIHAASNQLGDGDDQRFAAGFDAIANTVWAATGVKVGFFLDALPWNTEGTKGADYKFLPSSDGTGPWLAKTVSVLGIAAFGPEIYLHFPDTGEVLFWKHRWAEAWFHSRVPFVMDVSSGYDGRIVFAEDWFFGLNRYWLCGLDQMVREFGAGGVVFNSWNGYTEGMAAVPTKEDGSMFYDWLTSLLVADIYAQTPEPLPQRDGTWCHPYSLAEAIAKVAPGGKIGLLPTSVAFDAPATPITKPLSFVSVGGPATIGH